MTGRGQAGIDVEHATLTVVDSIAAVYRLAVHGPSLVPTQILYELDRRERIRRVGGLPTPYVLALDGDALVGLLPLYPTPVEELGSDRVADMFPDRPPDRFGGTVVLVGADTDSPNTLAATSQDVARALVRTAWAYARRHHPGLVCVPNLDDGQYEVVRASVPPPDLIGRRDDAYLEVPYGSFQEYLAALSQRQRAKVRRYRRALRDCGVAIRTVSLIDAVDVAVPLLSQCESKYGWTDGPDWLRTYLTTTALAMGRNGWALLAVEGGRAIAFVTVWNVGPYWRVRAWGCDYGNATVRGAFLYFNLNLFEPLERAIAEGAPRIELGSGSLAAKRERGAAVRRRRSLGWRGAGCGDG